MSAVILALWPNGAVFGKRASRIMDVILHLGSHRTGSTTFQSYMRRSNSALSDRDIGYWGPPRTRKGLFSGLIPVAGVISAAKMQRRAEGRVQMQLDQSAKRGIRKLLISDENMIGSVRYNLRKRSIYPNIGERMTHFARAFDGRVTRLVLNIRAQDLFWSSCVAYGVARGHRVLPQEGLENIAARRRSWREVITDLSNVLPNVEIRVLPFERYQGQPHTMLSACIDESPPVNTDTEWLNRAPDVQTLRNILTERGDIAGLRDMGDAVGSTRWLPFTDAQGCALREAYADDVHWLASGADGLATLTEPTVRHKILTHDITTENGGQRETGTIPRFGPLTRGQGHDKQERYMAGHR